MCRPSRVRAYRVRGATPEGYAATYHEATVARVPRPALALAALLNVAAALALIVLSAGDDPARPAGPAAAAAPAPAPEPAPETAPVEPAPVEPAPVEPAPAPEPAPDLNGDGQPG